MSEVAAKDGNFGRVGPLDIWTVRPLDIQRSKTSYLSGALRFNLFLLIHIPVKQILSLLLLAGLLGSPSVGATGDSLYFLLPSDTVILYQEAHSGHLIFDHYLAPGQSLYGAARFYGLSLEDIYHLNPTLRKEYKTGDRVRVTIPEASLQTTFSTDSLSWFVPVRYRLSRGQTLYGLTHRDLPYLDEPELRRLNPKLDPAKMSVDQVLLVGYLKITGVPDTLQVEVEDPYVVRNRALRELWEARTAGKRMKSANGKAAWTSKGDQGKWMVLHRTAPLNSLVEIEDPRSKKILYARVVGRIPGNMDSDVILVVSPLLVKAFGVRDRRFYVKTRYF